MSRNIFKPDQVVVSDKTVLVGNITLDPPVPSPADDDVLLDAIIDSVETEDNTQNRLHRYIENEEETGGNDASPRSFTSVAGDRDRLVDASVATDEAAGTVADNASAAIDEVAAGIVADNASATTDEAAVTAADNASAAIDEVADNAADTVADNVSAATDEAAVTAAGNTTTTDEPATAIAEPAVNDATATDAATTATEQQQIIHALQGELAEARQQLAAVRNEQNQQATEEARRIIAAAEEERDALLSSGRAELDRLEADARAAGQTDGFAKGYEQVQAAIARLKEITGKVVQKRQEILQGAEAQMVELVLLIARKVIKIVSTETKQVVVENVRRALELVRKKGEVTIRVNPTDLQLSADSLKNITADIERDGAITFIEDGLIEPGGCLIETEFGEIDARIHSQILEIEHKIRT